MKLLDRLLGRRAKSDKDWIAEEEQKQIEEVYARIARAEERLDAIQVEREVEKRRERGDS